MWKKNHKWNIQTDEKLSKQIHSVCNAFISTDLFWIYNLWENNTTAHKNQPKFFNLQYFTQKVPNEIESHNLWCVLRLGYDAGKYARTRKSEQNTSKVLRNWVYFRILYTSLKFTEPSAMPSDTITNRRKKTMNVEICLQIKCVSIQLDTYLDKLCVYSAEKKSTLCIHGVTMAWHGAMCVWLCDVLQWLLPTSSTLYELVLLKDTRWD